MTFDLSGYTRSDGQLWSFTSVGSYRILYLDKDNEVLCGDCASKCRDEICGASLHQEGEPEFCADCNQEMHADYCDCAECQ